MAANVADRPLVGRDAEIGALRELVRDTAAGNGHLAWIEGEPGIGKSALLAAGLSDARRLGCRMFVLAADELAQRFPLRLLLDGLRAVPNSADPDLRAIGELARGELVTGGAGTDPVPAISERLLIMLDHWCADTPVVLALDDIHHADEATLAVWHRLGRAAGQLPLLLVAAARPVPRRPELVTLHRTLLAAGATVLRLEPLSTADVSRLAGDLTGASSVGPALRWALAQAAGNPLYVREMVDALDRDGRIGHERGAAELTGSGTGIPRSLAAAIAARLGFVSDATLGVLRSAALLGTTFSVIDLATVSGHTVPELARAIDEAVAAGLLVESGSRLAFRHALIREALHEQTPSGLRFALHGHAARALHQAGAAADDVARQLLAALPPDEPSAELPEWVVSWLLRDGRALAHRSPQVAADLLGHAVRGLPGEDPRREQLQLVLASVLVLLGRRDEVSELAERILAGTRDVDHAAEMTWNLAWSHAQAARYEQARQVLQLALHDLDLGVEWLARLRTLQARVLMSTSDAALAGDTAQRAVEEARLAGDRLSAAAALHVIALTRHFYAAEPAHALDLYDQALTELGDDPQGVDLRLLLLLNRSVMLADLGRAQDADAAVHKLLRVAERGAAPPRLASMRLGAAAHFYGVGRWDDALAEIEVALDESDRLPAMNQMWRYGITGLVAAHRDNPIDADQERTMDRLIADSPPGSIAGTEFPLMARAALAERDGSPELALTILREWFRSITHFASRAAWLPQLVRLALADGDRELAADAIKAQISDDDLHSASVAPPHRAMALFCHGQLDADADLLLAAAGIYRDLSRPLPQALALEDAAVVLAGQNDRAGARAAYAEAIEVYTRLGAAWDLRRADTRLRPLGLRRQRAPKRRATTGWEALTPTELDVAHLVAQGLPNPDIATRLYSSRRTIEVHVSHILTKLDVRSRVDIARHAALHADRAPGPRRRPGG